MAMTRMEQRITALEATAQKALDELKGELLAAVPGRSSRRQPWLWSGAGA
jgi:hypothetical protein